MKKNNRYLKYAFSSILGNFINPVSFLILIAFSVAISWIPDGLAGILSSFFSEKTAYFIQVSIGFIILSGLFFLGYVFIKQQFFNIEIIQKEPEKKKNLIIFLSFNPKDVSQINTYEELKNSRTNWQMPIEAIKYHMPQLENILVVLSSKSKNQFEDFKNLVNRIFPNNNLNIIPYGLDKELDFEDMEDLNLVLEDVYRLLKEKYNAKEKEIIIDITGGQKLVSIIGAIHTLTHDREFQYISTTDYKVKSFDVRYFQE